MLGILEAPPKAAVEHVIYDGKHLNFAAFFITPKTAGDQRNNIHTNSHYILAFKYTPYPNTINMCIRRY